MLACNLNCWLILFNREEDAKAETLQHTALATARLRSFVSRGQNAAPRWASGSQL
jgi:hypothetical protein